MKGASPWDVIMEAKVGGTTTKEAKLEFVKKNRGMQQNSKSKATSKKKAKNDDLKDLECEEDVPQNGPFSLHTMLEDDLHLTKLANPISHVTTFGKRVRGPHNCMVMAFGSCVKWPF